MYCVVWEVQQYCGIVRYRYRLCGDEGYSNDDRRVDVARLALLNALPRLGCIVPEGRREFSSGGGV